MQSDLEELIWEAGHLASGVIVCVPCKDCERNANRVLELLGAMQMPDATFDSKGESYADFSPVSDWLDNHSAFADMPHPMADEWGDVV